MNLKNLAMWAVIVFLTIGLYNMFKNPQNSINKKDTIISFSKGFKFKINIERDFLLGKNSWKRENVSCVVIDGFVESIGEIHHLLEKFYL